MEALTPSSPPLLASVALLLSGAPAGAAALIASTFTSVGLTSTQDIDVTGPNVVACFDGVRRARPWEIVAPAPIFLGLGTGSLTFAFEHLTACEPSQKNHFLAIPSLAVP